MTPTNKDKRGVNYWIQGARNWAMWQDYDHDRYNAAWAVRSWHDLPIWTFEHMYTLLNLALEEKRIRYESESARDDSEYYANRLARIEKAMAEAAGKIE